MDGFSGIPAQILSALTGSQNTAQIVRVNAQIPLQAAPLLEALLATQKQGLPIRALVLKEHKDGSITVNTKQGEVRITPFLQQADTQKPQTQTVPPRFNFNPGDTIRLDIPAGTLTSGQEPVNLRVGLDSAQTYTAPTPQARSADTPVQVQVNSARPNTSLPPLIGSLKPLTPQIQAWLQTQQHDASNILNTTAQVTDFKLQTYFDTGRPQALSTSTNNLPQPQNSVPFTPQNNAGSLQHETSSLRLAPIPQDAALSIPIKGQTTSFLTTAHTTHPPQPQTHILFENNKVDAKSTILFQQQTLPQPATEKAGQVFARVIAVTPERTAIVSLQGSQPFPAPPAGMGSYWPQTPFLNPTEQLFTLALPQGYDAKTLPAGSFLRLAPAPSINTALANSASTPLPAPSFFLGSAPWPVMSEIFQSLMGQNPQAAQALQNLIPNNATPSNAMNIVPAAMLFIAAARGGDLQGWMGSKAAETLRASGKGDLLSRLGQEGQILSRMMAEPLAQDWRAITFPYLDQNAVSTAVLYYKNEDQEQENGDIAQQTRFVFDMRLSEMGKVQLDGLYRVRKLDLIVRTAAPLSPAMRTEMRRVYHNSLETSGLNGDLSFQNGQKHYFQMMPQNSKFEDNL